MNYLFHLYLSGDDPQVLTGNFMGDFVKGPIGDAYPPRLRSGLELHRRIDSFAQKEPHFTRSRQRLSPELGLYRAVMVDLYYDHFLAAGWHGFSSEPLQGYLARARKMVEGNLEYLPERLKDLLPVIFDELLPSYLTVDGVSRALARMSGRLPRSNPLAAGGSELTRHYEALQEDFSGFMAEARAHAALFLDQRGI